MDIKTLKEKRHKLNMFVEEFGHLELKDFTVPMVINYLIPIERSGSWKNNFITVVCNVYEHAPFCGVQVQKPDFPKFTRKTKKADIFTTEELNKLFE